MIVALTSNVYDRGKLYDAASTIMEQRLSQVQGVGQVTVGGSSLPAVRVEINPTQLNSYGLGLQDVSNLLSAQNSNLQKVNSRQPNLSHYSGQRSATQG